MSKTFEKLCRKSQKDLKKHLKVELRKMYDEVINEDGFLFAKGDVPILLVAHMDTVHKELPKEFVYVNGEVSSPQGIGGDDRCGIYMIMRIVKKHKCSVLFCEDEEIGCQGAEKFIRSKLAKELDFNYLIELDRRGSEDAVFYDCENPEFEDFIVKDGDWKTAWGSFSDISVIAPYLGNAAVNFSCGYYNAHTTNEFVVLDEMEANIKKVCKLIERTTKDDKFEYIEYTRDYDGWGYDAWGLGDGYYSSMFRKSATKTKEVDYRTEVKTYYTISYYDEDGDEAMTDCMAYSFYEAVGIFMEEHSSLCYNDIIEVMDMGEDEYNL